MFWYTIVMTGAQAAAARSIQAVFTQSAPCWLYMLGGFLYSTVSPGLASTVRAQDFASNAQLAVGPKPANYAVTTTATDTNEVMFGAIATQDLINTGLGPTIVSPLPSSGAGSHWFISGSSTPEWMGLVTSLATEIVPAGSFSLQITTNPAGTNFVDCVGTVFGVSQY